MKPSDSLPLAVAIYLPDFNGGGVERITLMLIDAFSARGVDVTVVVHRAGGSLSQLLPANAHIVSLDASRSIRALPQLRDFLRRQNPGILLSNLGHNNVLAIWARALAGTQTKVVICQHNALSSEASQAGNWQHRVLPWLYRWFGPRADAIVGVSHGVSDDLAKSTGIDPGRITTIHNPVIDSKSAAAMNEMADHPWFGDPSLEIVLGIGRLVPQKNFSTLIDAFALMDRPQSRLVILGEGPDRASLEQQIRDRGIADRTELMGFKLNPLPFLRRANVMVLSSSYEGFGNVLVEALYAGAPVVSTSCPYGPSEILEDGRYGRLVPVGDTAAMAVAIAQQLQAPYPARAERLARAAQFHVDIVSERYLQLFRSIGATPEPGGPAGPSSGNGPGAAGDSEPLGIQRQAAAESILMYLPNLRLGGAEVSMVRLADGFASAGRRVTIVIHECEVQQVPLPAGVELQVLPVHRSLSAIIPLAQLLRRLRPDLLISALPHGNIVAVAARKLARTGAALVLTDHAPLRSQALNMHGWRYRWLPQIARFAYPMADARVAVSRGVAADQARLLGGLTPHVIGNPVLPADWEARASAPVQHRWLDDERFETILTISRLSTEKDIPTLLRAFATLSSTRPMARLIIGGDGDALPSLQQLAQSMCVSDRVDFIGRVSNPLAWMRKAGVFALASRFEGFGNVIVEALSAGARVVCTDCPVGPREILQGGLLGRLVPVADSDAMARALDETLTEHAALRASAAVRELSPEVRQTALAFSQGGASESYLRLFDDVVRERGMPRAGAAFVDSRPHST